MAAKLTVSDYKFVPTAEEVRKRFEEDPHRDCQTGYLLKSGEILIGPRERSIFKTKRGAEKLLINHNGNVVKVCIIEEFPHPDMRS